MKNNFLCFLGLFICFSAVFFFPALARAELTITPTRVIFQDRDRFATVTLVNTGKEVRSYEMKWLFFRMQETGSPYAPSDKSVTEFDLSKYIVFQPRRVTLAPGATQKVRLALRRPETIPAGDYHIHLQFIGIKDQDEEQKVVGTPSARPKAAAQVEINVGYSIPVILRAGQDAVSAEIGQISIKRNPEDKNLKVIVPVSRKSETPHAIIGYMYLYHISPSGEQELVGEISNANIFPEVSQREFEVSLIRQISGGTLRVVLEKNIEGKKNKEHKDVYADKTFPLN